MIMCVCRTIVSNPISKHSQRYLRNFRSGAKLILLEVSCVDRSESQPWQKYRREIFTSTITFSSRTHNGCMISTTALTASMGLVPATPSGVDIIAYLLATCGSLENVLLNHLWGDSFVTLSRERPITYGSPGNVLLNHLAREAIASWHCQGSCVLIWTPLGLQSFPSPWQGSIQIIFLGEFTKF